MPLFAFDPDALPDPADPARAAVGLERLMEAAADDDTLATFAQSVHAEPPAKRLAEAVFGNSPFLTLCVLNDLGFAADLFSNGPDSCRNQVLEDVAKAAKITAEGELKTQLRRLKRRIALTTAVADMTGLWDLAGVTGALSDFADGAVSAAAAFLLKGLHDRGALSLPDLDNPELGSGLVILGMGKLGGRELNYSSDIDLILLFDPDVTQTDDPDELQQHFVRLARSMVSILDERTRDGYVFRTDLRLRPDPGSTPLALSTYAAETYYESIGQNWERAAMIKARPIAGDKAAGEAFLDILKPFVWRRSLDFASIQDIHSIKRQINAHKGGAKINLLGHNVKLGRGGIREIEFYAQTQQLIWGGRDRSLRTIATQVSLDGLAGAGHITLQDAATLSQAYCFLRKVEHRLQMINDEQTHSLPDNQEDFAKLAAFLGYGDPDACAEDILATLRTVETLYAHLFEDAPDLSDEADEAAGNLMFTGGEPDPDTLETLTHLGFTNAKGVDDTVRGWHHARYRATRTTRSRQILTELLPTILKAFAATANPDLAFLRFDEFLSKLPSGVQLFSMFQANPEMLDLLAEIVGTAPRLAEHLARKVGIMDGVLTPGFFEPLPGPDILADELEDHLQEAQNLEDVLNICRRWSKDKKFQIGVQVLRGTLAEVQSQDGLTNVAETLIRALQPRVEADFATQHGQVPGGGMCVVAFGKLGGREKTPTSDLDLTFIYDAAPDTEASDGPKPLPVSLYFGRLSQRLINAMAAPTSEGALYEIDMRLRPSGSAGPIATSLKAFRDYQAKDAWTWEHMALTRARAISGTDQLCRDVDAAIAEVLRRERDPDTLVTDVADMRRRMIKEHGTDQIWAIKHYPGGLVDIEFISQYLQLKCAHDHAGVLSPTTCLALALLRGEGCLDAHDAAELISALSLWHSLQGLLRLTVTANARKHQTYDIPATLQRRLCALSGSDTFADMEVHAKDVAARVRAIYEKIIDAPAAALTPQEKD